MIYGNEINITEAAKILTDGTEDNIHSVSLILEDGDSPRTKKYRETLYQTIIDRAHVDFGDIPKSKGDITKYSGYQTMTETLNALLMIAKEEKSKELMNYVTTVSLAIDNLNKNKVVFSKAFAKKNETVQLDYNLYTYTCVEATTSLISAFVNDIKTPSSNTLKIDLKDTKYRGDLFYIKALEKFNTINKDRTYTKYVNTLLQEGGKKENFAATSAVLVGAATVTLIALSIIPITRKLIYRYKESKRKLSEALAQQAYFLELNKTCIEYNNSIDTKKKKAILKRQEKVRKLLLVMSDKFKIDNARAKEISDRKLDMDNRTISIDTIDKSIEDSDIKIL